MNKLTLYIIAALTLLLTACGNPKVILETEKGDIVIEVFEDKAPKTAADFLYYVDEGLYDDQGFYRVVRPETDPREMGMTLIQGGRLNTERLTPYVDLEPTGETGLSNISGSVSMARDADLNSGNAAYFFINNGDNSFLDQGGERDASGHGYAVFGKVVSGMDVVAEINALKAEAEAPEGLENQFLVEPVKIITARRK